jgi:hypothetical protein
MADLAAAQADLEARLVDTIRVTRVTGQPDLDPHTGLPGETPTDLIYEGDGALLSTHGQIVFAQLLGIDWASEGSSWYQLLLPLAAPTLEAGDLVEVTAQAAASGAAGGRVWLADEPTQVSSWEIARVTRLEERVTQVVV